MENRDVPLLAQKLHRHCSSCVIDFDVAKHAQHGVPLRQKESLSSVRAVLNSESLPSSLRSPAAFAFWMQYSRFANADVISQPLPGSLTNPPCKKDATACSKVKLFAAYHFRRLARAFIWLSSYVSQYFCRTAMDFCSCCLAFPRAHVIGP